MERASLAVSLLVVMNTLLRVGFFAFHSLLVYSEWLSACYWEYAHRVANDSPISSNISTLYGFFSSLTLSISTLSGPSLPSSCILTTNVVFSEDSRSRLVYCFYLHSSKRNLTSTLLCIGFARFLSPYLLKCDLTKTPNLKVLSQSLARHQLGLSDGLSKRALDIASAFLQGDYSVEEEVFGFAMEELLSEIKPEQFWKNDSLYPLFEAIFKTNRYAELAAVLFRPRGNAPLLAEKLLSCLHSLLFFQFPSCEVSHINMSSL